MNSMHSQSSDPGKNPYSGAGQATTTGSDAQSEGAPENRLSVGQKGQDAIKIEQENEDLESFAADYDHI